MVLVFLAVGSAVKPTELANAISEDMQLRNKASAKDTKEYQAIIQKGRESYNNGNYDQAIAEFTEAIQLNTNYTDAYSYRALAYTKKGNYDLAIADYDKEIQMYPKSASAYNNRAWIYYHIKKDFNRAISDANQAVSLNSNSTNLDTRGWIYLSNGDYDKAIADFEKALQSNSSLTSSREGLAQARLARIEPVKDEDFEVKQNADNTITITNYKGTVKSIIIPDKLYGLKVTIIGGSAFQDKGLISVVIPDTIITIENGRATDPNRWEGIGAFSRNKELIKVILGNGLKTIGDYAFIACYNLTEIIIPNSVTRIGNSSFSSHSNMYWNNSSGRNVGLKVTLGTGLQTIGDRAFYGCGIEELNLPSSLREFGERAFSSNKIQKITFGTGLQNIEEGTFSNNQITELNLPSSLKTIGANAFSNNKIQSLTIPNGVTFIWDGAFANNPLTTVVIPTSASIFSGAFGDRDGSTITRITIPAGMKEDTIKGLFEEAFVNFWINQNRAGGTYVK